VSLAGIRARWQLQPAGRFASDHAHVEPVTRADGTPAVLKVGPPGGHEAAALAAFGGRAAARLLASDPERGALLVERLEPGTPLAAVADDDAATLAAADVMRRLHRPPPADHGFPDVAEWGRDLPDPGEFAELCASSAPDVLLHGDLHHFNILRHGDGWAAIDPKGVIGEPAYETGALLRNPAPALLALAHPRRVLVRRAGLLAEALDLDAARILAWARVQAVLAAVWADQDGDESLRGYFARCAELLGA
jgi:streptomycin 6-kinase